MKKICAITMARNDEFFLSRWIEYYGGQFGKENLYILLDGLDQKPPKNAGAANITLLAHEEENVVIAEKKRLAELSNLAAALLKTYDLVIGCDADEFLAVDPKTGKSLSEYLSGAKIGASVSGLGLDVGQKLGEEPTLDPKLPFLRQRSYALLSPRYTKPSVLAMPLIWGSGFHRVKGHNFHIDKNLLLFHFGSVDYEMLKKKFFDREFISTGRGRHLGKRAKTVNLITKKKAVDGDKVFLAARLAQTILRPLYSLNKPSMAGFNLVVKIPERFKDIV